MAESKAISHSNNFAIIHFICACMVIYGHQFVLLGISGPLILGSAVHALGVKMIFVMTGYLVAKSFLRDRKFGNYMKRRLIRIYPAYAFVLLVSAFVMGPLLTTADKAAYFSNSGGYVISNLLMNISYNLPGVFESNVIPGAVNGSIWTMPVEILMYVVVALLCILAIKIGGKKGKLVYAVITAVFIILQLAKIYAFPEKTAIFWGTEWCSSLVIVAYFVIGSLFAVAKLEKYCNFQVATLLFIIACMLQFQKMEIISIFVVPYFIMSFALCEKPFFGKLFRKNNIAYGVYLWGFPVQQTLIYVLCVKRDIHFGPNVMFILSIAVTIVIALFSHRFIETPIEGFLKKKLIRK